MLKRRTIIPGLALFASASLLACGGGSERDSSLTKATPSTMALVPGEITAGKDASQMPIQGKLDAPTCLTLKGLQALLGKPGTGPVMIFGDASGVVGGQINVADDELRSAADALTADLTASGNIPADLAHASALAAVSTTEQAALSVEEALSDGSMSLEGSPADSSATAMLDQARTEVAQAIQTGCYHTFSGRNFYASR